MSKCKKQCKVFWDQLWELLSRWIQDILKYTEGNAKGRSGDRDQVICRGVEATGGTGSGKKNIWGCDQLHMSEGLPIFLFLLLIFRSYFIFVMQISSFGSEVEWLAHDNLWGSIKAGLKPMTHGSVIHNFSNTRMLTTLHETTGRERTKEILCVCVCISLNEKLTWEINSPL